MSRNTLLMLTLGATIGATTLSPHAAYAQFPPPPPMAGPPPSAAGGPPPLAAGGPPTFATRPPGDLVVRPGPASVDRRLVSVSDLRRAVLSRAPTAAVQSRRMPLALHR